MKNTSLVLLILLSNLAIFCEPSSSTKSGDAATNEVDSSRDAMAAVREARAKADSTQIADSLKKADLIATTQLQLLYDNLKDRNRKELNISKEDFARKMASDSQYFSSIHDRMINWGYNIPKGLNEWRTKLGLNTSNDSGKKDSSHIMRAPMRE